MARSLSAVGVATLAVLLATSSVSAQTTTVQFDDFSDVSDLTLNGRAATIGNPVSDGGEAVLRLTDTSTLFQAGSAFLTDPVMLAADASFSTAFSFRISDPAGASDEDGPGADGLVFVVQTVANNVGAAGSGIGYGGIENSLGVEFDTFNNGDLDGSNGNHVGINFGGDPASVARLDIPVRLNDGALLYSWVDYDGSTDILEVRGALTPDRPEFPLLGVIVDLPAELGQDEVFVGFTSATGAAFNNHDIRSWTFVNTFAPVGANVPPVPQGIADGDVFDVIVGEGAVTIPIAFASPEAGQTTTISSPNFDAGGFPVSGDPLEVLSVATFTTTPGNPATAEIEIIESPSVAPGVDTYTVTLVATDDGSPAETTTITITINVMLGPPRPCEPGFWYVFGFDADGDGQGALASGSNPSNGEFVLVYAAGPSELDLSGCDFVAFDARTERVTFKADLDGVVLAPFADTIILDGGEDFPEGSFPDGPGAIAFVQGGADIGDPVSSVLGRVAYALVYVDDENLFGVFPASSPIPAARLAGGTGDLGDQLAAVRAAAGDVDLTLAVSPNPVREAGAVSFSLPIAADVRVAVYDVLGREVAVLARGTFEAGAHRAPLDAAALPAGAYVVRLTTAGGVAESVRITVVR